MIESLFKAKSVEKKPQRAFLAGFVYTVVSVFIVLQLGTSSPAAGGIGFLTVAFISIAGAPFFLSLMQLEELHFKGNIFKRHEPIIIIFAFFFLGVVIASSLMYVAFYPAHSNYIFSDQVHDLAARHIISGTDITGQATIQTGGISSSFDGIFVNNLKVLAITLIASFVFGVGAIFIIAWNATILGVLIGKIAENPQAFNSILVVKGNIIANYIIALPLTLIRILPHGIFEFLAYFLGAVAGGILSVAILHEKIVSHKHIVFKDCAIFTGIAVLCLLIGAVIEVAL